MASKTEAGSGQMFLGGLVLFGGLGALFFGWPGFLLGCAVALAVAITSAAAKVSKSGQLDVSPKQATPAAPPFAPSKANYRVSWNKQATPAAPPFAPRPVGVEARPAPTGHQGSHRTMEPKEFEELLVEILALCVACDGRIDEAEIGVAIAHIERAGQIKDKARALDAFRKRLDALTSERLRSKALFDLTVASFAHRLAALPKGYHRPQLVAVLDAQAQVSGPSEAVQPLVERLRRSLTDRPTISSESAAEEFLKKSGDKVALQAYQHMRQNPATFGARFKQAASNSSVMRTALGVFTGMIAADLVMGAVRQQQLEAALADFDKQLESIGGTEALAFPDSSMETSFLPDPSSTLTSEPADFGLAAADEQVALTKEAELADTAVDQQDDTTADDDSVHKRDYSSAEPEDDSSYDDSSDSSDSSSSFDFDSDF